MRIYFSIWTRRCLDLHTLIEVDSMCVVALPTIPTPLLIIHSYKSVKFLLDLEYWHFGQWKQSIVKPISLSLCKGVFRLCEFDGPSPKNLQAIIVYNTIHFPHLQTKSNTGKILIIIITKSLKIKNIFLKN